eukprot:1084475-Rhodomonas_salina.2
MTGSSLPDNTTWTLSMRSPERAAMRCSMVEYEGPHNREPTDCKPKRCSRYPSCCVQRPQFCGDGPAITVQSVVSITLSHEATTAAPSSVSSRRGDVRQNTTPVLAFAGSSVMLQCWPECKPMPSNLMG